MNRFKGSYREQVSDSILFLNGGYYTTLIGDDMIDSIKWADVIYWFADVPNDKKKIVANIKTINPRAMLVISKNNLEEKYGRMMLVARALAAKANLLIEFTRVGSLFGGTVIDPLNNIFVEDETNIDNLVKVVHNRIIELSKFTRVGSKRIGDALAVPKNERFFEIARKYADVFHDIVHSENQERFLGNLSFRCERGFPSFRKNGLIFVSQRNIDKRNINENGFVAVTLETNPVEYYGDKKPSVDTPIQVLLYNYYPNVNYMLHAHVFIDGAPTTHNLVPCGATEEFAEIASLGTTTFTDSNFCVNLKGHGCLILANDLDYLESISFIAK